MGGWGYLGDAGLGNEEVVVIEELLVGRKIKRALGGRAGVRVDKVDVAVWFGWGRGGWVGGWINFLSRDLQLFTHNVQHCVRTAFSSSTHPPTHPPSYPPTYIPVVRDEPGGGKPLVVPKLRLLLGGYCDCVPIPIEPRRRKGGWVGGWRKRLWFERATVRRTWVGGWEEKVGGWVNE